MFKVCPLNCSWQTRTDLKSAEFHYYYFLVLLKAMSLIEPKTLPMFYFTKENATTPTCPIELRPNLNPSRGFQTCTSSDADCTKSAKYNVPFFKDSLGPKFEEYGASSDLLKPGQHTQVKIHLYRAFYGFQLSFTKCIFKWICFLAS